MSASSVAEAPTQNSVPTGEGSDLTVADAVWITSAYLQRKSGPEESFDVEALSTLVQCMQLTKADSKSIRLHVQQHCVANKKPQPNRSCVLFEPAPGKRRLYRSNDIRHPERKGGKTHPAWDQLPKAFADLQQWYEDVWENLENAVISDPLLALIGTGNGVWDGKSADEYVLSLRSGWGAS